MQTKKDRRRRNIEIPITAKITDVSTASSSFVVCPFAGTITKIYSAIQNAITTAPAVITFELGGVAITGAGLSITNTSSAAGDVDSSTPTALNSVSAGQAIEIVNAGASETSCEAEITIMVVPTET